jgi:hypothetical protein
VCYQKKHINELISKRCVTLAARSAPKILTKKSICM